MKTDNPSYYGPALTIIKKTDPALYAEMQASRWQVFTISRGDEDVLLDLAETAGPLAVMQLIAELEHANAVTMGTHEGTPMNMTFVNKKAVAYDRTHMHIPPAEFIADMLVHEFTHNKGTKAGKLASEHAAYTADCAFARKLPHGQELVATAERRLKGDMRVMDDSTGKLVDINS
jgi:hypothetical protein